MVGIVKLVGILVVVMGAIFLVKPATIKKITRFWLKDKRLYVGAVLNIFIGIILLVTASKCAIPWIVVIIGIWSLLKGMLLFVMGPKKISSLLDGLVQKPVNTLRIFAVIALCVGVLIIYAA